ncbi:hypothetical protein [Herbaspirillum seropedicae]|uniref:hypothetical protein n=1 Tax=Herbaspirillum seropedicae TaxID=964 RepID=UPI003D98A5F8
MATQKHRTTVKGLALDLLLDEELASMLADGIAKSPISFMALTARLGLNSRSTLHTPVRKEKILRAIQMQLDASGKIPSKIQRRNQAERIVELERQNAVLQTALDHHIEQMCRVIANATAKGWDVEFLLRPLLPNNRNLTK